MRGQGVLEWYEALISAALVLVLVFSFFFRIIQVDGSSMVPTLVNGDKLIVWGAGYTPQRGDVVIVDSYTSYGKPLVKRVIAKGGDTISIDYDAGTVEVNGELLQEDYIAAPTHLGYDVEFPYTVPVVASPSQRSMFLFTTSAMSSVVILLATSMGMTATRTKASTSLATSDIFNPRKYFITRPEQRILLRITGGRRLPHVVWPSIAQPLGGV